MQSSRVLRQMLGLVALCAALWLVHLYGRVLAGSILMLLWILCTSLIGLGLWQQAKLRRRVWIDAYLLPQSSAFRLLRPGLVMALVQCTIALILAMVLLLAVLRLDAYWQWAALLSAALAFPPAAAFIAHVLRSQVQPTYREELAQRLALRLLAGAMLLSMVWLAYTTQYADFRAASLEQAVWYAVSAEQARSRALLRLLEIAAATEGLHQWLAQHLLPTPGSSVWQALAWCIVLAQEALFVWSYLLLCRGALALPIVFSSKAALPKSEKLNAEL